MSRGRTGRGYEQVGIDFAPGKDGVEVALPFNRHHLLIGRVPLKQPEQAAYEFPPMDLLNTGNGQSATARRGWRRAARRRARRSWAASRSSRNASSSCRR